MVLGRRHAVPVAAAFLRAYPEVLLHLRLTDSVINLQEEHVDIAIRIGALPDSNLVARQIGLNSMARRRAASQLDLAQAQRERYCRQSDQCQHPEGVHVGEE